MMTNNDEANSIAQDLQTSQDNQTAISEATKINLNAEEHRNLLWIWGCGEEFDSNNEFDDSDCGSGYSDDEIGPETGVLKSEYALYYENTRDTNMAQEAIDDFVNGIFDQIGSIQEPHMSVNQYSQYQNIYEKQRFLEELSYLNCLLTKVSETSVAFCSKIEW